nr:hypothetical protein [Tanacetum cinerariifolium]
MRKKEEKETEEVNDITGDAQVKGRQAHIYQIDMDHAVKVLIMQEDESEVQEAVEVVTTAKLIIEVIVAVSETVSAVAVVPAAVTKTISTATVVPIVIAAPFKVVVPFTRRRRGVVIRDPKEESSKKTPTQTKSKDKGKGIMVEEPKPMKKKQQVELDEAYGDADEQGNNDNATKEPVTTVSEDDVEDQSIPSPTPPTPPPQQLKIYHPHHKRVEHLEHDKVAQDLEIIKLKIRVKKLERANKTKEQIEEEENRAIANINETLAQKAAKRRRVNEEAKDVEELKQHLEIVPDEDDDVYTEATSLARKVPVVDYQIVHINNKPHFKIIRADETHQLYVSFITLLKNFDREDLESLWNIVKERFSTLKPNNFSDDFLLTTLKAIFGRPDGQD